MITQDFMGPKKKSETSLPVGGFELWTSAMILICWVDESSDFFPNEKNPTFLGESRNFGIWKLERRDLFGKSKSHHVPWPEDGSSMVNQFFSIQWPEDGIVFNSKDPSDHLDPRSKINKAEVCVGISEAAHVEYWINWIHSF
jgi:hypothetical protein